MAGSAGSPPPAITDYVCPECGRARERPECEGALRPRPEHEPARGLPVEYVPREQSDALHTRIAEAANGWLYDKDHDREALTARDRKFADEIEALLNSYREATSE
jgi:hypothetical protein